MTRSELAASAGVSERLVASLELGDARGIRLDKLLAVCGAVGLGIFMGRRDSVEPLTTKPNPPTIAEEPPAVRESQPQSENAHLQSYEQALKQFLSDYGSNSYEEPEE